MDYLFYGLGTVVFMKQLGFADKWWAWVLAALYVIIRESTKNLDPNKRKDRATKLSKETLTKLKNDVNFLYDNSLAKKKKG